MENSQIEFLNSLLRKVYQLQREQQTIDNDNKDNVVLMLEKYNKDSEYFYFQVYLIEMLPKPNGAVIYENKIFPNISPQQIYLGCLKGDNVYLQYKNIIEYQNPNINLLRMVTPNLNKNLWYLETDLINNRLIRVLCKMNLINMKNMLKNCLLPNVCFYPALYNLDDPESFVKIINDNIMYKKVFDFIPYIREFSIVNKTINQDAVYYLFDTIKLVDSKCFE